MNNFGTLTFAAWVLKTDSDFEAEVTPSEVVRTSNTIPKSFWRCVSDHEDSQRPQVLMICPEAILKTLRQEVLMNSPSFWRMWFWSSAWRFWRQKFWWTSPASKDLKILKTKCQSFWRQEVLMNVSRLHGLEVLNIKAKDMLILIKLR